MVAHQLSNLLIFFRCQLVDALFFQFLDGWILYALSQDGPESDEVGVGTGVGLHVGVVDTEKFLSQDGSFAFDRVDIFAAGVEAVEGETFTILVGQKVAHGELGGERRVVFGGDEFEVAALIFEFIDDAIGNRWRSDFQMVDYSLIGGFSTSHGTHFDLPQNESQSFG
ncbi:MAG: hypothetical protein S4CHLAM81_11530 [Chlamydiales bacterium]|nr:hypothetical protein [Chlamydiales bacterium]